MKFDLIRPCKLCPFRNDVPGYLRRERAEEIANALRGGEGFPCHKTTKSDEEGETITPADAQHCAGALIAMENGEEPWGQLARIAERIGYFHPENLDWQSPVATLDEFIEHHDA